MIRPGRRDAGPGTGGRGAGFTLLEVLVAFVIAAAALGVLYRGSLDGLQAATTGRRVEEAVSRAQSRLAAIGHGSAIVAGSRDGQDGRGFRWRTRIAPAAPPAPAARGPDARTGPFIALFDVSVAVAWEDGGRTREVRLDTRRAVTVPPPGP